MPHTEMLNNLGVRTVVLLLFLLSTSPIKCTTYGSDTAPSRQAFVSISSSPNTIAGFAGMYNGFSLTGNTSAVAFNSRFPVGTLIGLRGGTITLSQDLFFDSSLLFGSPGIITGNNNAIEIEAQNQTILLPWLGTINLLNSQNANSFPYAIDWSPDGQYVAVATQGTATKLIEVYLFNGFSLNLSASTTFTLTSFNALAWQPGLPVSYYFVAGAYNTIAGLYAYQFTPPSTLTATCTANTGTFYNSVAWHPVGNIVAVSQTSINSQQIQLYNFSAGVLTPNSSYSFADPTQVVYDHALAFDYSGNYLAAGCSNANQLQVFRWNGTSLISTASANTGQAVTGLSWSPNGSLIAVGPPNGLLQIYNFNRNTHALTLLPSYNVSLAPSIISGIGWSPDGHTLAVASHYGTQLQLFAVNLIRQTLVGIETANGGNTQIYTANWSPKGAFLLTGDNSRVLSVFNFIGPMNLQNTNLILNSPAQLHSSFVCTGSCIIDCNGYTLDLNSQIVTVTTGASLLFRNAVLEGITGTNLQCIDNTGAVSFRNATCIVNNTMQWNQGSLAILGDCTMTGTGKFIYSSNQTSTIYPGGLWYFDRGMTFSYYPQSGANNLIYFADNTAQLSLYETALYAQATGLQFTTGTLIVDGRCPFYSAASTVANGILIGDGSNRSNNVNLMILPESGIDCRSGYVVDQNVGS